MPERPNGFEGKPNTPSPIAFDDEGFHDFEVPQSCQFIVSAKVNRQLYGRNPNSLFVEFKDGYLAHFKSDEVAEHMSGELANELETVAGVSSIVIEDREVFIVNFQPGVDIETLLTNIDNKVVEISKWDKLPE
jgi:molecular chaperone DnaK (HSP70)